MKKNLYLLLLVILGLAYSGQTSGQITGSTHLCIGSFNLLSDATTGGSWSSSNTAVAIIGTSNGYATGVTAGTATITYTAGASVATITVTVTPAIAPILGYSDICVAGSGTLTDTTAGGIWSSSNAAIVTINAITGAFTALSAGEDTIYYSAGGCSSTRMAIINDTVHTLGCNNVGVGDTLALNPSISGFVFGSFFSSNSLVASTFGYYEIVGNSPGDVTIFFGNPTTGCAGRFNITVTPVSLISPITGITPMCPGGIYTLADATSGGLWSSSPSSVATVSATGVISTLSGGGTVISYSVLGGTATCTSSVLVHPLPTPIAGPTSVCAGDSIIVSSYASQLYGDIWWGGSFTISDTNIAKVVPLEYPQEWAYVIGVSAGTVTVTFSNLEAPQCSVTSVVTVNASPAPITGPDFFRCPGGGTTTYSDSISGGSWASSSPATATIGSASGILTPISSGTTMITYTLPGSGCFTTKNVTDVLPTRVVSGPDPICVGASGVLSWFPGCTWSSGTPAIATIDPSSGLVTGLTPGITTIHCSMGGTCVTTSALTVNPLPSAITGPTTVCVDSTVSLVDGGSGSWTSGAAGIATIGSSSGIVTGVGSGTATIFYTLGTGCSRSTVVTVNPIPIAGTITGTPTVCVGASTAFIDLVTGGVWSSGASGVATVSTSGLVSGVSAGTATISYSVSNTCVTALVTKIVTVNPLPVAGVISGPAIVCPGATISLASTVSGGVWSTGGALTASVTPGTGVVTGVAGGSAILSYTVTNGCGAAVARDTITVNPLPDPGMILGSARVCSGSTITLTDAVSGGVWTSTDLTATVSGGVVTGITSGLDTIKYSVTNICGTLSAIKEVTIDPLPPTHVLTGGGSYCSGAPGLHIGISGSDAGVFYQLLMGVVPVGGPFSGTGLPLDFGIYSTTGLYNAIATNSSTGCNNNMTGIDTVSLAATIVPTVSIAASPGLAIGVGESDTLTTTVSGGGATPTYQWYRNGIAVSGATNSTYYSSTFFDGDSMSCEVMSSEMCGTTGGSGIIIAIVSGVGVKTVTSDYQVVVFPNPNKGTFTVSVTSRTNEDVNMVVTNVVGEKVKEFTVGTNNATLIQLNADAGIYFLSSKTKSGVCVTKVIVSP